MRPFSGAIVVGMARPGGFDPEIPVQNGTRQHDFASLGKDILQIDRMFVNGRLQKWPKI
jgi:hypothetical protein